MKKFSWDRVRVLKKKQQRMSRRKKWKKYLKMKSENDLFIKPLNYQKLKKYEDRKKRNTIKGKSDKRINDIKLPSKIDFEENIENVISVSDQIKNYMQSHIKGSFRIDHSNITSASIAGMLYLVGQVSRLSLGGNFKTKNRLKYNKHYGLKSSDDRLKYLFYQIGYWEYFGIKKPYTTEQSIKDNYFLSIESNYKSDILLLNKIKKFIKEKVSIFDSYIKEYKFDDAIKEAMGNAIEHAYTDDFEEVGKVKGKWWICGHYDNINKTLELVFYDYGIGIRESMKKNMGEEAERRLIDKFSDKFIKNDADLIGIAIDGKLSKYKKYKERDRGKGFQRFKDFAKSSGFDCDLTVASGNGSYKYSYLHDEEKESVNKKSLSNSIDGMLIKWKIKIGDKNGK